MMTQHPMAIGIFGGTFDPVHNGHLRMALEAKDNLGLDEVRLVPCHYPPHRDEPSLSSIQRLEILNIATKNLQGIVVDDRELKRDQLSYSIDTLDSFREELGDEVSLVLMMGMDAFVKLTSWHQWQRLRELAHIAVMVRPDSLPPQSGVLADWLANSDNPVIVKQQAAGGIILLEQSLLAISATAIREQLEQNRIIDDVPLSVAEYLTSLNIERK